MSWKNKLHPSVSRAEEQVFAELSRLGLTGAMVTQKPIILRQTIPDFWWIQKQKVVFLDGEQAHKNREDLDLEIQDMLEAKGFQVLRISYKPPLGKNALDAIIDQIRVFLGETEE